MKPEAALRLLDGLDGFASAARLVCAGYWGRRLRLAGLTALGLACTASRFLA